MTLTELIAAVRLYAQEPSIKRYTDAEVTEYLNICYQDIMKEARQRRIVRLDVTEQHDQYQFVLPDGITDIESILLVLQDGTRKTPLEHKTYNTFVEYLGSNEVYDASPTYYTIHGNTLRLDGKIDSTEDSHLEFSVFDMPADLSSYNYTPEFSSAYHRVLAYGAAALMYLADKEADMYRVWQEKFIIGKQDILLSIRRVNEKGANKVRNTRIKDFTIAVRRRENGTASYS